MNGWLPPALVLMAALGATYLCCLRPYAQRRVPPHAGPGTDGG